VRKERELRGHIISGILSHAHSDMVGRLLKEDGTPDKDAIKRYAYLYLYTDSIYELNPKLVIIFGCLLNVFYDAIGCLMKLISTKIATFRSPSWNK
jgi:hypothetical protein